VGSTELAVRHDSEGFLFAPGDVDALVEGALLLKNSPALRKRLGDAARSRFEEAFDIREQHQAFLKIYAALARGTFVEGVGA
jgi:glycosyltransferase involved in cell wall biosynthesis